MPPRFPKAAFVIRSRACESAGTLNVCLRSARGFTSAATGYFFFARFSSIAACAGARRATGTRSQSEGETACRRQPEAWSGSDINRSSPSRRHRPRPSTSKNAEGAEAFWTQAKPEPPGRAHQTGRANQTFDPIELPWQAIIPSNCRGRPFANGFPTTMRSHAPTCSTSAPTLASRSRSPAKTVPSSSSIPTEATERTAPEKPLPNRYLAQRSGSPCS